jgi:hypothetical protein
VRGDGPPAGGRNSMTSTRGGGGSSIRSSGGAVAVPWSVATAPQSRGRATAGPLCRQAAASPRSRGGDTFKAGEQATPVDV